MIATATDNNKTAWLGEFPSHWQVLRIKNLFQEMDSRSESGCEELLSVSHYTGITLKRESLENEDDHLSNAESLVGYKLVAKQDLVINIMLAWNGSLGISPFDGMTSPAYCVYRIKGNNNPEYFGYLFTTNLFKAEFRRNSTGIIDSRLRLYSDKFFSIFSVVPPSDEQDEIVQFIKSQEEKINLFIQKKQRFIELLREQRQSIISNVILNGLTPNIKRKASGIEWIGDIPSHWEIKRLRFIGNCQNGINKGAEFFGTGFPFVSYSDVYYNEMLPESVDGLVISSDDDRQNYSVIEGDVFFTRTSETVEEIAVSSVCNQTIPGATFSGFLIRFRPFEDILFSGYSKYYFRCQLHRSFFVKEMNLITRASLNQNLLKNLPVIIPPIEEQKKIVQYIETETATTDAAIAKAEKEIELIKEYKAAMISEAVMGNINEK